MNHDDHRDPDQLDRLLDESLARYSQAEPLAGLEDRILARLEAAPPQPSGWRAWLTPSNAGWALAALMIAAGIALGMFLVTRPGEDTDYIADGEVIDVKESLPVETVTAPLPRDLRFAIPPMRMPKFAITDPLVTTEVRSEVFPSPAPLSEQENLALMYARNQRPVVVASAPDPGIQDLEVAPVRVVPLRVEELEEGKSSQFGK